MTNHKIIIGDSRNMAELRDESVHLVVTSPPYWQLKDYGNGGQIGFDDSYEDYINNLNLVWQQCHRVLNKGCRLCVNIGDQFARSVYYGRYKVIPIRTEIIKFCETVGFDYMGAIIWQKVTTCNTTGGATIMGSFPFPRNGILKIDYEFILLFKKHGKPPQVNSELKEKSARLRNLDDIQFETAKERGDEGLLFTKITTIFSIATSVIGISIVPKNKYTRKFLILFGIGVYAFGFFFVYIS